MFNNNSIWWLWCLSKISVEIATLTRQNDKTVIRILPPKEVQQLITDYEKAEAEAEAAKKEKAQKSTWYVFSL